MGYGISTTLMYGVFLNGDESIKLRDSIWNWLKNNSTDPLTREMYDEDDIEDDDKDDLCLYTFFKLLGKAHGTEFDMVAEDSDSRIHGTTFEEGFDHGVGVVLGKKGYGARNDASFNEGMKHDIDEDDRAHFEHLKVFLNDAGLGHLEPSKIVVSCTL